ncbi:uncharacterized protein [Panulirus ornatus]|uniref:uncharacterized protein n=1 Tax=Panulirus ornatus TaxID=150431 RepID=UPI003A87BE76
MACLSLLSTFLTVVATGRLVTGIFNCPADDGFTCSSCSSLVYCSGGKVAMELPCSTGQLCGGDPNICRDSADTSLTDCKCGTDYPSYVEDPHDDQKFLICLSASLQVPGLCPEGQAFDIDNPPCVAGPTPTTQQPLECTESGIFPVLPSCGGYYGCSPDGSGGFMASSVTDCDGEKVFNPDTGTCVDSIDPAEITCTAGQVAVADTVECNAFHICSGAGEVISGPICCPGEGQVFNSETMICEPDKGNVKCPTLNPCATEVTRSCLPPATTTSPTDTATSTNTATLLTGSVTHSNSSTIHTDSTASSTTSAGIPDCSSSTGAYPVPGDCKRYYYCLNGKLYYLTCAGQLVFNPGTNTCDLPANYPQCA